MFFSYYFVLKTKLNTNSSTRYLKSGFSASALKIWVHLQHRSAAYSHCNVLMQQQQDDNVPKEGGHED